MHGYLASKTEAEKAAWDFVKKENVSFDLAVINPVYVFGPFIHPVKVSIYNFLFLYDTIYNSIS